MKENWVRTKRNELGVSQYKMAKCIGVTFSQLSAWEMGKVLPTPEDQKKIEYFFEHFADLVEKGVVKIKKQIVKRSFALSSSDSSDVEALFEKTAEKTPVFYSGALDEKAPTAITLFSGVGGMSLGFVKAGYRVLGHVELEDSARKIYSRNFPDSACLGKDIREVTDQDVLDWKSKFGPVDVLAGGPPCQGFSLAGKRNVFDSRNELYNEFARVAGILQPKCVLLENVRTFLSMQSKDGGLVKDDLIRRFHQAGYTMVYRSVNAKNYGAPQSRERVIFVGVRNDLIKNRKPTLPEPTHSDELDSNQLALISAKPLKTFRDAVGDLDKLESGQASKSDKWHFAVKHPDHVIKMFIGIPEGKSAHENPDPKLRPTSGYNTTYKRLVWDEPSSTISTNFSMISGSRNVHPRDIRSLTIREAMRCQTFPDNFDLVGSLGAIRKGIGNAVPPVLAEAFARHIREKLLQ